MASSDDRLLDRVFALLGLLLAGLRDGIGRRQGRWLGVAAAVVALSACKKASEPSFARAPAAPAAAERYEGKRASTYRGGYGGTPRSKRVAARPTPSRRRWAPRPTTPR